MAFERVVDAIIEEALLHGNFQDWAGNGRPIDLSNYFDTPAEIRNAYSLLKNAGILPLEIQLLKEIEALKDELSKTGVNNEQNVLIK